MSLKVKAKRTKNICKLATEKNKTERTTAVLQDADFGLNLKHNFVLAEYSK